MRHSISPEAPRRFERQCFRLVPYGRDRRTMYRILQIRRPHFEQIATTSSPATRRDLYRLRPTQGRAKHLRFRKRNCLPTCHTTHLAASVPLSSTEWPFEFEDVMHSNRTDQGIQAHVPLSPAMRDR